MHEELNIEQLVQSKLGEAEVAPSADTWTHIRKKVRRMQFLKFRPGRFNIWYLGILLISGAGITGELTVEDTGSEEPLYRETRESVIPEAKNVKEAVREPAAAVEKAQEQQERQEHQEGNQTGAGKKLVGSGEILRTDRVDPVEVTDAPDTLKGEEMTLPEPVEIIEEAPIHEDKLPLMGGFTSSVQSGCAPLTVQFRAPHAKASTYRWSFGTGDRSSVPDPLYTFREAGQYTVLLTVAHSDGTPSEYRQLIEVHPAPKADFQIEEGFEGIDNHLTLNLVNYSSEAAAFSWSLLEGDRNECSYWSSEEYQPVIRLKELSRGTEEIRLIVTGESGCRDTLSKELPVEIASSEDRIRFPNAFSPNPTGPGSGMFNPQSRRTDLFHPVLTEVPVSYHLTVYTRRGKMIFETREVYRGWDGYINQERVAGGVYVWMVEGTWEDGAAFSFRGDVTLIWNELW